MARQLDIWDDRSERMPYDFPCSAECLKSVDCLDEGFDASMSAVMIAAHKELLSAFPNYSIPSHWHDDAEFVAVRRGKMVYNVNGEDVPMKTGEGVFVNARQLHFAASQSKVPCDCEYVCVQIHPAVLCASDIFKQCFVFPVIDKGQPFVFLSPDVAWQAQMLDTILSIFELRKRRDECIASPITALSLSMSLWALLFEHLPRNAENADVHDSDLAAVRNMVGFIQQNYADNITLSDIASSSAMGQNKCCSLFAKYFKQSPVSYLNRHRLSKSAQLLRTSGKSVTEIALAVGFGGASYFAYTFKKWAGISPSEYRKAKDNR